MERASTEPIAALSHADASGLPAEARLDDAVLSTPPPAIKHPMKRCQSGKCRECGECLENARWERIFAEKFADPGYYNRPVVRTVSPLSSL